MMPFTAFVLVLFVPAAAASEPHPAQARSEQLIAAFKKVKPGGTAAQNQAPFSELDALIDFETITTRTLQPRAQKLSPAQRAEFHRKFSELIRLVAYPDSGTFFRKAKLTWKPVKTDGEQTLVTLDVSVPEDDLETVITLHWGRAMKIVDVSFDGDSLVRDYQNQIARILDKEGASGLMKRLDHRRAAFDGGGKK